MSDDTKKEDQAKAPTKKAKEAEPEKRDARSVAATIRATIAHPLAIPAFLAVITLLTLYNTLALHFGEEREPGESIVASADVTVEATGASQGDGSGDSSGGPGSGSESSTPLADESAGDAAHATGSPDTTAGSDGSSTAPKETPAVNPRRILEDAEARESDRDRLRGYLEYANAWRRVNDGGRGAADAGGGRDGFQGSLVVRNLFEMAGDFFERGERPKGRQALYLLLCRSARITPEERAAAYFRIARSYAEEAVATPLLETEGGS